MKRDPVRELERKERQERISHGMHFRIWKEEIHKQRILEQIKKSVSLTYLKARTMLLVVLG